MQSAIFHFLDMFPGVQIDRQNDDDIHSSHCCLVAIGRLQVTSTANSTDLGGANSQSEFISRHAMDGKFSFVDQRVINVLGYTPAELLGKSCYDFFHPEDQSHMKENFEQVLKQKGQMFSVMYRFRSKAREWIWLRTQAYAFLNPYTDEVEYIVCTNSSAKYGWNSITLINFFVISRVFFIQELFIHHKKLLHKILYPSIFIKLPVWIIPFKDDVIQMSIIHMV